MAAKRKNAKKGNEIHVTSKQLSAISKGMKLTEIRSAMPALDALCRQKIDAAAEFSEKVKLVAEKAGVSPAVLSTYITAVCKDTVAKKREQAEQLEILFDEFK